MIKPLPVYCEGINIRDWLYVEDRCKTIDFIIHKGTVDEVYSIGEYNEMRNIHIVKFICKELGKSESLITYVADRKGHDMHYAIDLTKIHKELVWVPETKFADGIKKAIKGYLDKKNGGRVSLMVNISIIMKKCIKIDTKRKGVKIMKTALITGVTGQDGSYLAEFLLEKGYAVHGIVRRASSSNTARIVHLLKDNLITLHDGDLTDSSSLIRIINLVKPNEIYNLAAQSHVQVSFDVPEYSGDVDALGVLRILEAVRILGMTKTCRIYQASTSELYGKVEEVPQSETTPFHPYSPYAVAKQYGFWITKEYREAYGMFAVNGILFNHESERRGENFVTRKITLAAGRIAYGLQDHLELGNLDSLRDWGYAKDYVECMWLMLQHDVPEDFVIATGEQHTVRDFTEKAFKEVGISLRWEGTGIDEKGYDAATGKMLVCVNPQWFRPTDVDNLWGNPAKAKAVLGWNPQKTSYEELIKIMVQHDYELAKKEAAVKAVK